MWKDRKCLTSEIWLGIYLRIHLSWTLISIKEWYQTVCLSLFQLLGYILISEYLCNIGKVVIIYLHTSKRLQLDCPDLVRLQSVKSKIELNRIIIIYVLTYSYMLFQNKTGMPIFVFVYVIFLFCPSFYHPEVYLICYNIFYTSMIYHKSLLTGRR